MAKSIKEVNGLKIIKRYSVGAMMSALFCFIIVAAVVLPFFIPFLSVSDTSGTLTHDGKTLILALFNNPHKQFDLMIASVSSLPNASYVKPVYQIGNMVAAILYLLAGLIAVVFTFIGFEFLFRGRLSHHRTPIAFGWVLTFVIMLPFAGYAFAMQFILQMVLKNNSMDATIVGYWPLVFFGIVFLATLVLHIIYACSFRGRVFVGDVYELQHLDNSKEEIIVDQNGHIVSRLPAGSLMDGEGGTVTKEVPLKKKIYGLPTGLQSIGGHAFSTNLQLDIAIIPQNITSLGVGAFANCLNLKMVSLPRELKKISRNCFFNCASLKRLNYGGTKEEWRHIVRGSHWLTKAGTVQVYCIDGPIIVDPTR